MTARHVVVIGGGLAGITAAIGLRDAGTEVTLLEARPWLGGATSSFRRGELSVDNGQHVFLRCCTAYQELLGRLGMTGSVSVQDRFDVTVLTPGGGQARLRRTGLPGPFHMTRALAGYSLLPVADRLRVGRAALAMRLADPASPALDQAALGDWLAARGQRERARRLLWDLFIVSALNVTGDRASAGLAATVIKTALLGGRDAADIGVPAVPLGQLHGQAAADLLGRLGAEVRLGTKAVAVQQHAAGGFVVRAVSGADGSDPRLRQDEPDGDAGGAAGLDGDDGTGDARADRDSGTGGDRDGALLRADGVILAVPGWTAARLVPPGAAAAAARWTGLGASPIVNVHVIYDRPVTSLPFAAAVDSPVQWVFDKTRQAGLADGQYLAVSLSAADAYVDVPAAKLRDAFLPALEALFPAASTAQVTDCFVTRERRATFRQGPGCGALRPSAATSVPGFVLAGAWTDTGWPDTMEGAVRSGMTAAQEITSQLSAGRPPAPAGNAGSQHWASRADDAAVAGADAPAGAAS